MSMRAIVTDQAVNISTRFLENVLLGYDRHDFMVRFWDGTSWGNTRNPRFVMVINHPGALRQMFSAASELSFGEAFVRGDFDLEGDIEAAFELGDYLLQREQSIPERMRIGALLLKLPAATHTEASGGTQLRGAVHSRSRDRAAVTYHYDVSNDFYSLWLDRRMVYSCAYFKTGLEDIDRAQEQKLEYICRKLRLQRGDHLLDLGCGWGGLMCYAAVNFGVQAFGITFSQPQADFARARFRAAGVADKCIVEVCDYRELDPPQEYDKIVSVGMFEHVGGERLPEYFRRAWSVLRPGGVFLNHGIAASATRRRRGLSFMDKYVFPDGDVVPLGTTIQAAESCQFEVRDVESLREHYALTLRRWVRRIESKGAEAVREAGEQVYRIWRLYMAGSAHAFCTGRLNLYQVLLSKPVRGRTHLPLTREDWYHASRHSNGDSKTQDQRYAQDRKRSR
jgi:cyclopropane-fatty-acyl-phospholipid synthase